jgi:hypothetical protein
MNIMLACSQIDGILLPIAACCSAAYIFLAERALRSREAARGFEVQSIAHAADLTNQSWAL